MTDDMDIPSPRPSIVVQTRMLELAQACETGIDETKALHQEVISLILELRVPRMPESDQDLARMLERAGRGPFVDAKTALERIRSHGRMFEDFLAMHRALCDHDDWNGAAEMLLPGRDAHEGAPDWPDGIQFQTWERENTHVTLLHDESHVVEGRASVRSLSILAAILKARVKWNDGG